MWGWINSPLGYALRDPLPGSTNYLNAYDRGGNLKRLRSADPEEKELHEITGVLPRESQADLRPFPLNHEFISQPVLSEALREKIWESVMKEGKSVDMVSAQLKVEMSRVGAVVRLKEVEKEWLRKVCETKFFFQS